MQINGLFLHMSIPEHSELFCSCWLSWIVDTKQTRVKLWSCGALYSSNQYIMFAIATALHFYSSYIWLWSFTFHAHGCVLLGSTACSRQRIGTMGNSGSWSIIWRICGSYYYSLWRVEDADDDCSSRHGGVNADDSILYPSKWGPSWALQGCDPPFFLGCSSRGDELCRLWARQEGDDQRGQWVYRLNAWEESHGSGCQNMIGSIFLANTLTVEERHATRVYCALVTSKL